MKGTDQEIINGIANSDHQTLTAFYERNYRIIQKLIITNSGTEGEVADVFQDALLLMYQKIKEKDLQLTCSIHTYFYAICKNLWMNKLRRKNKIQYQDQLEEVIPQADVFTEDLEMNLITKEKEALFRKYLLQLGEPCTQLLVLVCSEENYRTIAQKLGITEGNVRKKKFDCKEKLLKMIRKDPAYRELTQDHL